MFSRIETKPQIKKSIFQVFFCIFGIGKSHIQMASRFFGYKSSVEWKNLSNKKKAYLFDFLTFKKEMRPIQQVEKRKNFLISTNSFRGSRIISGLPVRGQRTKTNRKTARKLNR